MWFIGDNMDTTWLNKLPQKTIEVINPIKVLKGHIEIISTLLILDNILISSGYDKILKSWDLNNNCHMIKSRYLNKRGGAWALQFWDNNSTLYSGGHDKKIYAWNADTFEKKIRI